MRALSFARRNVKEILRDPLSLIFALALPLFLLFIFQQFEIPSSVYRIENFTPGVLIFGFSFLTMFTALQVAKDRSTSFLLRLGVSPMTGSDYVIGYILAMLPMVAVQNLLFFPSALLLGLSPSLGLLWAVLLSFPFSLLFIALGIAIGSVTTEKSSSGLSSIVVQLVAFTGGMYFEGEMVGGFFGTLCKVLPFEGCVSLLKCLITGEELALLLPLLTVALYTLAVLVAAVLLFRRNMLKSH